MHVFRMISHRNSWSGGLETQRATLPEANTSRPAGIRSVRGVSESVNALHAAGRRSRQLGGIGCMIRMIRVTSSTGGAVALPSWTLVISRYPEREKRHSLFSHSFSIPKVVS